MRHPLVTSVAFPILASLPLSEPAAAQIDLLQPPPTLPSLSEPPALEHALLENPIPLAIAAAAVALAAWAIASRAGRRRTGILLSAASAALGLAAILLSLFIRTGREELADATRSVVAAVAEADAASLERLLAPDARLYVPGARTGRDKSEIIAWIQSYLTPPSPYTVGSHRVSELQAEVGPSRQLGRTRARVNVTPAGDARPTSIVCMLTWRKSPNGEWGLVEIDPLWLMGWGDITERDMSREIGR